MIIYNVTCNLNQELEDEWLDWMKNEHLPEVMSTNKFLEYRILKLLTQVEDNEGVNYAIQYRCATIEDYHDYINNHGPVLREKTIKKYGDKVLTFRTLLQEIK